VSELPERLQADGFMLRRWRVQDAERLDKAIRESIEHLRPWIVWVAEEPRTLEQRRELLARWERQWMNGEDRVYGVFVGDAVAGSCGLHRRLGPCALEIGYWIHAAFVRRGLATKAVSLVTDIAFTLDGISRVEIHHDKANQASAGVPRHLGYRLIREQREERRTPGETGTECVWGIERDEWRLARHSADAPL
jgi:RimJ/RimL family protein N-acetyltransferase